MKLIDGFRDGFESRHFSHDLYFYNYSSGEEMLESDWSRSLQLGDFVDAWFALVGLYLWLHFTFPYNSNSQSL